MVGTGPTTTTTGASDRLISAAAAGVGVVVEVAVDTGPAAARGGAGVMGSVGVTAGVGLKVGVGLGERPAGFDVGDAMTGSGGVAGTGDGDWATGVIVRSGTAPGVSGGLHPASAASATVQNHTSPFDSSISVRA